MEYVKEFFRILGYIALGLLVFAVLLWPLALEGSEYFWVGGVYYGALLFVALAALAYVNVENRR